MPAARSRTQNWRRTLEQVCERNGALEIAIPRPGDTSWPGSDGKGSAHAVNLIWRVRLLKVSDDEILIEEPVTMGQTIEIRDDISIVAVMAMGQNRWMFKTRTLGRTRFALNNDRKVTAIRLQAPKRVERCQRRSFYRASLGGLLLPKVELMPLLDVETVIPAEMAVRARIEMLQDGQLAGYIGSQEPIMLPEVGPPVDTVLVNLGGGGAGLMIEPEYAGVIDENRVFWMSMSLLPYVPAPLSVMARLAHVRMDSEQRRYLGMAFVFDHNPSYRKFVSETLCRCVNDVQREQLRRRAES